MGRIIIFIIVLFSSIGGLIAQETTCPCHDCDRPIEDGKEGFESIPTGEFRSEQDFHVNIFNVLDNDLSSLNQCVKEVKVRFRHDYIGDVNMFLISPSGQSIELIGPAPIAIENGNTGNTAFDITFIPASEIPEPEAFLDRRWDNAQEWGRPFGTRAGSYYPHSGDLEDFNQGPVNGSWTLRIWDSEPEGDDVGQLIDFSIEFCNPAGVECDPCEEEREAGIPCVFRLEASEEQITPIDASCMDVFVQNVAFVESMQWAMTWNPTVINNVFIQNINNNIPGFTTSDFSIDNTSGTLQLDYQLPSTDTLGAVVSDSSLLFQLCFDGAGEEGDSTLVTFSDLQVMDIEGVALMTDSKAGLVRLTVDVTADCETARQLCGMTTITEENTKGPGFIDNEGAIECWGEDTETQSKWYTFDVLESGTLDFMVQPSTAADFRYTLFKGGCGGEVTACFTGGDISDRPIGVSSDGLASFGVEGKFAPSLDVESGESYYLVIDNQSNNGAGFQLFLAGTSIIGDQTLNAVIAPPPTLSCAQDTITLNTSGTSIGDQYTYEWDISVDNFVDDSNVLAPVLDQAGSYTLMITDASTQCMTEATVDVSPDFNFPVADAGEGFTLNCVESIFELDGSQSSTGNNFSHNWTFIEGSIFQMIEPTNALVNQPGTYIIEVTDETNGCISRDTVVVGESKDNPNLSVENGIISCANPIIELSASSDTAGVIMQWEGEGLQESVTGTTIMIDTPGEYTVTATAPNGCTTTQVTNVADDTSPPDLTLPPDDSITCTIEGISLTATSNTSNTDFTWISPINDTVRNAEIFGTAIGTYLQIITAENGCTTIDSVRIFDDRNLPNVVIEPTPPLTCDSNFITLNASISSSIGDQFVYTWSSEDGTFVDSAALDALTVPVLDAGTYQLRIFDINNECENLDTIEVRDNRVFPSVFANDFPVSEGQVKLDTLNCFRPNILYTITSSAAIANFRWLTENETLANTDTFTVQASGNYRIRVVDLSNNCSSIGNINISIDTVAPVAEAGETQRLNCAIGMVSLDGSNSSQGANFSYLWTNESGTSIGNDIVTEVTRPGVYRLTVVNSDNGCLSQDETLINASLDIPNAVAGPDAIFCTGGEDALIIGTDSTSQGDNFSYAWRDSTGKLISTELTHAVFGAGIFSLEVTNTDNLCTAVDSIQITEQPTPNVTIEQIGDINCRENLVTYIARSDLPNTTIRWEGVESFEDSILTATDALLDNEYIAVAEDNRSGCKNQSQFIKITENRTPPIVNPGTTVPINCQDTVTLNGSLSQEGEEFSYIWTTEDGNIISATDSIIAFADAPGTYVLTGFNSENFCSDTKSVVITDNRVAPTFNLGPNRLLSCDITEIELGRDSVPTNSFLFYNWYDQSNTLLATTPFLSNITTAGGYRLQIIDSFNLCTFEDTVIVVQNTTPPEIDLVSSVVLDCTVPSTRLEAVVTIGNSFTWNTSDGNIVSGETTLSPLVNAGGEYILNVENTTTGCTNTATVQVVDNQQRPQIDAGSNTNITCFNNNLVTLNGSIQSGESNLLLEWSATDDNFEPTSDTLNITIATPATYFLRATNPENACIQIDSVVVGIDTSPIALALPTNYPLIDCRFPELEIGDTSLSINDTTRYQWTTTTGSIIGPTDTPVTMIGRAGNYSLEVTNILNGCTSQDDVTIEAAGELPTVDIGSNQLITCNMPEVQLGTDKTSNGTNFTYLWLEVNSGVPINDTDRFLTVQQAGTYQLVVQNTETGCESSAIAEVAAQTIIDNVQRPMDSEIDCTDSIRTFDILPDASLDTFDFDWTTDTGNFISPTNLPTVTINQGGIYYFTITNTFTGCTTQDSVRIENNQLFPMVNLGDDQIIPCDESSITLTNLESNTGGELEFTWTNETGDIIARTPTTTVTENGQYMLSITNLQNGCQASNTVTVQENTNLPSNANLQITPPSCEDSNNASIQVNSIIGGQSPYNIQLNGRPINDSEFDNLRGGEYVLTIEDALGCDWDTTLTIDAPAALDIQIIASTEQLITGDLLELSIGGVANPDNLNAVNWLPSDVFECAVCLEQSLPLFEDTNISLEIVDENGCEGNASVFIEVNLAEMPNAITPNGDGINDFFRIPIIEADPNAHPDNEIVIFNRWGDVVYRASPYQNDWDGTHNGQPLPEGTYYYVLRLDVSEGSTMKGMVTILK